MNKITVTATFIGANGSFGFELNKEYELEVVIYPVGKLKIRDKNSDKICIYDNLGFFINNWKSITKI